MKAISVKIITLIGVAASLLIMHSYGNQMTLLYGGTELIIAAICYVLLVSNINRIDEPIRNIFLFIITVAVINSFVNLQIKSPLLMSISLVLPLTISALDLEFSTNGRDFVPAFLLALVLIAVQAATGFLGDLNSNTFGFFCYMGLSIGFIWLKSGKRRFLAFGLLLVGFYLTLQSGSRNVAVVMLLCIVLLLIPKQVLAKKAVLRTLYIVVLVYTLFADAFMEWGFSNEKLSGWLIEYTSQYSEKAWDMDTRLVFFREVQGKISQMNLYQKLFGEGVLNHHGHNMFYQSVFVYGYAGTILIYAFFIRIFEMGIRLVTECDDMITYGCLLALLGNFMLNGADLYLIGTETCAIIPQVIMGLIMYRYRVQLAKPPRTLLAWGSSYGRL